MAAAQLAAGTGISIADEVRGLWRISNNDAALPRGCCAREARIGYDLFGLRPVAFAMRADQEQPLVAIDRAEHRMPERILAKRHLRGSGKFSSSFANGFEFAEQPIVLP